MRRLFPALASGLLLGMAYPPAGPPGLGFLALAPLLIRWSRTPRASEAYGEAVLAHVVAFGIAFRWVAFHPIPSAALASVGGVLALAIMAAVPYAGALALSPLVARLVDPARAYCSTARAYRSNTAQPSREPSRVSSRASTRSPHRDRRHSSGTRLPGYVLLTALVVATEAVLARGPWALPWTTLSHTVAMLPQAEWAAVIGGPGLSALVVAANVVAAEAWIAFQQSTSRRERHRACRTVLLGGTVLLAVLALPHVTNLTGQVPGQVPDRRPEVQETDFVVTMVQPASSPLAWSDTSRVARVDTVIRRTRRALAPLRRVGAGERASARRADLVVWPETTLPPLRGTARTRMHRRIQALVDSLDIPLLTGAVDTAPARDGRPRYRNRVRLFLPGASPPDARSGGAADASLAYDKHHLVPFAEHVPLVDDWPALQRLSVPAGGVAGYVRGPGPVLFSIPTRTPGTPVRIAPLICFETVVGPYVQTAAEKADVIVAVSQVGWWGTSGILPQYRALTRLRALETGRPIVVATVTGPSFVARPDGTVDVLTDWMSSTTSHAAIPISR